MSFRCNPIRLGIIFLLLLVLSDMLHLVNTIMHKLDQVLLQTSDPDIEGAANVVSRFSTGLAPVSNASRYSYLGHFGSTGIASNAVCQF